MRSAALNAVCLSIYAAIFFRTELDLNLNDLKNNFGTLKVSWVFNYFLWLYAAAFLWGLILGILNLFDLHNRIFLRGWTNVSPYPNVWNAVNDSIFRTKENLFNRNTPQFRVPWVRIVIDERSTVFGRLLRGNVEIFQDKPFEIFLKHAVEIVDGQLMPSAIPSSFENKGMYLKVTENMRIQVFSGSDKWKQEDLLKEMQSLQNTNSDQDIIGDLVYCSGSPALAHPGVYFVFGEKGTVNCPYCNLKYSKTAPSHFKSI